MSSLQLAHFMYSYGGDMPWPKFLLWALILSGAFAALAALWLWMIYKINMRQRRCERERKQVEEQEGRDAGTGADGLG